jgi:hypothetical protein
MNLKEKQVFDYFNKNQNKLTLSGWSGKSGYYDNCWFWRGDEKSYKEYTQLSRSEKENYIEFLLLIDEEDLSTNDEYILKFFGPENKTNKKPNKFLEL